MLTRIIYNNNIVATGVIHILRFDRRKRVRTTVYYYDSITRNRRRRHRADVRLLLLLCIYALVVYGFQNVNNARPM